MDVVIRELNPRDRAILTDIDRFGFLTTSQVQRIHFNHLQAAARICRRVINRLVNEGLLTSVDRRIGGWTGGSSATVWRLSAAGYRLINDGRRTRLKLPSDRFLDHRLAVAECFVQLVPHRYVGKLDLLEASPEPGSWRQYLGIGGRAETLKPDLYLLTGADAYEDHWFLEIDRGTESLPTISRKCAQYEQYRRTGSEQHVHGVFPVVLWVVPDEGRAAALRRVIAGDLFRIATIDAFASTILGGAS